MKILNKKLAKRIGVFVKKDQELRKNAINNPSNKNLTRKVNEFDKITCKFVEEVINTHKWPGFKLVGRVASRKFWLLVQHCDQKPKLQKIALDLLKSAIKSGNAHKSNYAYLYDRVALNLGKKQKFGTQFIKKNNKFQVKPLISKKFVNKYRKEYGLNSIEEQALIINKIYKKLLK